MPNNSVPKKYYHPWIIRLLYIALIFMIALNWNKFRGIPTYFFSWTAVWWILNLYRNLNQDKTTIQNEFFIAFWVRLGWATSYSIYSNSRLYTDKTAFTITLIQTFISAAIYTSIPIHWVQKLWSIRLFRWFIFVVDQIYANGYSFLPLVQKQVFPTNILVLSSKATARPIFQILTGFFNNNLFWNNLRKWLTICYLNTCRMLLLALINYLVIQKINSLSESEDSQIWLKNLEYFNVCYYGFVGYLMYIESYTL